MRDAVDRLRSSVQRSGRSPTTATTRSTIVACARGETKRRATRTPRATICSTAARRRFKRLSSEKGLPLAVLEPLARARLAVLLAFLLARVAREEACALEGWTFLGVERAEGTRYPVTHRFGLCVLPAPVARGPDVELVLRLDELERLPQHH